MKKYMRAFNENNDFFYNKIISNKFSLVYLLTI